MSEIKPLAPGISAEIRSPISMDMTAARDGRGYPLEHVRFERQTWNIPMIDQFLQH